MNTKRLIKTADFLDTLPKEKFAFDQIAVEGGKPMRKALKAGNVICGTVGCVMGWSPVIFPRLLQWVPVRKWHTSDVNSYAVGWRADKKPEVIGSLSAWDMTVRTAMKLFDLDEKSANYLFHPEYSGLGHGVTPKEVAKHIREFVASPKETND